MDNEPQRKKCRDFFLLKDERLDFIADSLLSVYGDRWLRNPSSESPLFLAEKHRFC